MTPRCPFMNKDTPTKVSWPRIHECTTTTTTTNIEMYTLYEGVAFLLFVSCCIHAFIGRGRREALASLLSLLFLFNVGNFWLDGGQLFYLRISAPESGWICGVLVFRIMLRCLETHNGEKGGGKTGLGWVA